MNLKIFLLLSTVIFFTFIVSAQEGAGFKITKSTIDGGGGISQGGGFKMSGTVGQADASLKVSGGGFQLSGGFWAEGVRPDALFQNGFEN